MQKNDLGHRLLEKFLVPITAAAASAGATYVVRKGPQFFEATVAPRLRELVGEAESAARDLPDLAERLTQQVATVVGSETQDEERRNGRSRRLVSGAEFEHRRGERAKHRAARRGSSRS